MAYVTPGDLLAKSKKSWAQGYLLTEADGDATYIASVIADVEAWVDLTLDDDFEPAGGDPDVTLDVDGSGMPRLYIPKRVRSITTVELRAADGTLTVQAATLYRLRSSISNGVLAGGADYLELIGSLSTTGGAWPYGINAVKLTGKFGWAAPPSEIKRLVALLTFDRVKAKNGNLRRTEQLQTRDATYTFVDPEDVQTGITEADDIIYRYSRRGLVTA